MAIVLILGLAAWVFVLNLQLGGLRSRADGLERRLLDLKDQLERRARSEDAPSRQLRPGWELDERGPMSPSRPAAAAGPHSERVAAPPPALPPEPVPQPRPGPAAAAAPPAPPPPRPAPRPSATPQVRAWLEEHLLAWAGGAALALGGLFLVVYAAQRGVFTPPLRIAAAVALGSGLLGSSGWLRRRGDYALPSALAAGAGAATLYGAVWAAYWLYAFIDLPVAGGLLAAISLGLVALAFRHGEALAILAVAGGFLAPAITGPERWTAPALTAFLGLMTVTGFAVAATRRWGRAGLATLAGAFLWAIAGFAAQGYDRVMALGLAPLALAYAAVEWRRRSEPVPASSAPGAAFDLMPGAALLAGALAVFALGFAGRLPAGPTAPVLLLSAGLGAALIALLAAYGARRRMLGPLLHAVGYAPSLGLVALIAQATVATSAHRLWGLADALALAAAGVLATTATQTRGPRLAAAAATLPVLGLALAFDDRLAGWPPWTATALAAVILLGAAVAIARRTGAKDTDVGLGLWLWAAGAAAIYALWRGVLPAYLPVAAGVLSLIAASAHARLGWRGLAGVMIAGATASLSALLAPALFRELGDGGFPWWALAGVAAASAALTYAGAWLARRAGRPAEGVDAQTTAAVLVALAGAGVLLRLGATAGASASAILDPFTEAALRDVLILAGGLTTAQAVRTSSSLIGRWRGQVLLLAGLAHAIVFQVLALNPAFADWKPPVAGPPLADSLLLGFLAPAALLGAATWKKVALNRTLLGVFVAGAALLATLWTGFELRRLFQGASLAGGLDPVGRGELAAYAVALLLGARGALWAGGRAGAGAWTISPIATELQGLARIVAWAALGIAVLIFGLFASPWWGPIDRPLAGRLATLLLLGLYVAGAGSAFALSQAAEREAPLGRAARLSVVIIAFALVNILTRLAFRGYDMRPNLTEASLETWAFSAVWGLYGFGLVVYGAARRSNDLRLAGLAVLGITSAKIVLFDMAHLDGVVRAASFLAVGGLLLGAAILVRRLTRTPTSAGAAAPPPDGP